MGDPIKAIGAVVDLLEIKDKIPRQNSSFESTYFYKRNCSIV